jgi:2-oxoglutarate ferredoxin oxidoreductase subunit beta
MDNQIYGLTKGQLSPTSHKGARTVTSPHGSLEAPVNPLLYLLAYGAGFVAQGTPADMPGLTAVIEAAIRYPGFAFVNVQSPCVTYGEECQQIKTHKVTMQPLDRLGHDPADRLRAFELATEYGAKLHTGVLYRNPDPPPTFGQLLRERQQAMAAGARPRRQILDRFLQGGE